MKDTYPKGKFLVLKSKLVIYKYNMEYLLEQDMTKRIMLGKKLVAAIKTFNQLPEAEWKGLNKQLKKVDDVEQIKAILKF